jgi:hypothetical protein
MREHRATEVTHVRTGIRSGALPVMWPTVTGLGNTRVKLEKSPFQKFGPGVRLSACS